MTPSSISRRGLALLALAAAFTSAHALDVAGYNFEPTVKVAGKELKLNGAGVRTRVVIKVYALGFYLPEKQETAAGVLDSQGPRRFTIAMFRDVTGEEFGQAFMSGITANADKAERSKFVNQIGVFGEVFATVGTLKKGDVLNADWIPGTGLVMTINGKSITEPIPDLGFYNAVMKIWIGDKPVDTSLKPLLLGGKA